MRAPEEEVIWRALKEVQDPELHESIVDLGLIYTVQVNSGAVVVNMTLTTPFCPMAPEIQQNIENAVVQAGYATPTIELVWDPPWDPSVMCSDEIKDKLGLW